MLDKGACVKYINLTILSVALFAGASVFADAPANNRCNTNQPVVIDSCMIISPVNVSGAIAQAQCSQSNDHTRWTCQVGFFYYEQDNTLYFPLTQKTVVQKTTQYFEYSGPGNYNYFAVASTKDAAINNLKRQIENSPGTTIGLPKCAH